MIDMEIDSVNEEKEKLQIDAITDLALRSSAVSISSIALQALSALVYPDNYRFVFPPALIDPLRLRYKRCFGISYQAGYVQYKLSVSFTVAERLTRAMLCFPNDIVYDHLVLLNSLAKQENFDETRIIAMRILSLGILKARKQSDNHHDEFLIQQFRNVNQAVHDLPSTITLADVHRWTRETFRDMAHAYAGEDPHFNLETPYSIMRFLNLNSKAPPAVWEEQMIRSMHTRCCTSCTHRDVSSSLSPPLPLRTH